jgi:hypothetical protein
MKGGPNLNEGDREALGGLSKYCGLCGRVALAHAAVISDYCGTGDVLPDPIGKFSLTLSRPSVTMTHLRRRPGEAGSPWPDRLERIGGALQVCAASGQATVCKNILPPLARAATNDVEARIFLN